MDTSNIVKALKQERDRIDAAIEALSGKPINDGRKRRSRNGKTQAASRRPGRRLSAAARKRISAAAKARWAKTKKAGRSSL